MTDVALTECEFCGVDIESFGVTSGGGGVGYARVPLFIPRDAAGELFGLTYGGATG